MLYHFLVPLAQRPHPLQRLPLPDLPVAHGADHGARRSRCSSGPWLVGRLRAVQHGGETIREDTPERHRMKKGTPTMGGVLIVGAIVVLHPAVGESRATATCGWWC